MTMFSTNHLLLNRTIGCETEYGAESKPFGLREPNDVAGMLIAARDGSHYSDFIKNGGRLYVDCGHAEYSTPECTNPLEAAQYHHAGDVILTNLRKRLFKRGTDVTIRRDNIDWAGTSYGFHENYQTLRTVSEGDLHASLIPFLVTSQMLFGSGYVSPTNQFNLSVRGKVIDVLTAWTTTAKNRAIISTRDEPHLSEKLREQYRRLHITCHDCNVSQTATYAKLGITCLVLSYIEAGGDLSDLFPLNPVEAMKLLNVDMSFKQKIQTPKGKKTALEIQWIILGRVNQFLDASGDSSLPNWAKEVWNLWVDAVTDLQLFANDQSAEPPSSTWIDWWVKWKLFSVYQSNFEVLGGAKRFSISMEYHDICPENGLAVDLICGGFLRQLFTRQELQHAAYAPSKHPRPQERATYLSKLHSLEHGVTSIGWTSATIHGKQKYFAFPE